MKVTFHQRDIEIRLLDSLVKVFPDEDPTPSVTPVLLSVPRNDRLSLQMAVRGISDDPADVRGKPVRFVRIEMDSPAASWITLRTVELVPVRYPAHRGTPDLYLRKTPGLYPDILQPLENNVMAVSDREWRSLWIDIEVPAEAEAGCCPVSFSMLDPQDGSLLLKAELSINILPFTLPEQTFPRTEWFHSDCLADYYRVEVFSEEYWTIVRAFIAQAVRRGISMILTPQFTPPLDTAVGWERTTVQLVEVFREPEGYRFDFSRLIRWIRMCQDCGVRYFEMSHLFSQWGAVAAPKIMGWENGTYKRLFGWDTPASGDEYRGFLNAYLPELRKTLQSLGAEEKCWFHISDEPNMDHLESYSAAREAVEKALGGCRFFEALSDYSFYSRGCVETPVCATNHLEPFLAGHTPHLWTYYCTGQSNHVSNCFIAQPSGLTRLYGIQMYKFGVEGSLRWGYNFYRTAYSYEPIQPFLVNDGGGCFPAGDPFIVYPGRNGRPLESIRMLVLDEAIRDLRVLKALEERIGREKVLRMVDEDLDEPLTFERFPDDPQEEARYVLRLRQKAYAALE